MLSHLTVNNFALATDLSLEFHAGFTVLTGETGAGKSLLLDALQACLGERLDGTPVRFGSARADLTATFDIRHLQDVQRWMEERELTDTDEQQVRLRRVISADNKSRAWINGVPSSLGDLRQLADWLVQINSQHSQQRLLRGEFARQWLDLAAGLTGQAEQVRTAYRTWQAAHRQWQQAVTQQADLEASREQLAFQIEEVSGLQGLDYVALEQEHDRLTHADSLLQDGGQALTVLTDNDGLVDQVGRILRLVEAQVRRSDAFASAAENLMQAQAHLQDAGRELQHFIDHQELDPQRLAEVDAHLREFNRLARKYRLTPEALWPEVEQWQRQLTQLTQLADLAGLTQQVERRRQEFETAATALDQARQQAAPALARQIISRLKPLALPESQIEFVFQPLAEAGADGAMQLILLFGANRGMPLQPLAKVASGGELSRLALVMQVLIAEQLAAPLLVFDEVDIGIGGGTAEVVGRLLRQLGERVQVICITHQPQVAAQGHQHLVVSKQHGEQTVSTISLLTEEERVTELARMSGGVDITENTLRHARELLDSVQRPATDEPAQASSFGMTTETGTTASGKTRTTGTSRSKKSK